MGNPETAAWIAPLIGLLGILIGGLLQTSSNRWKMKHDRRIAIRKQVSEYAQTIADFTAVLVQLATYWEQIRADSAEAKLKNPKAKPDFDEDHLLALGTHQTTRFAEAQSQSLDLTLIDDARVASMSNALRVKVIKIMNETAYVVNGQQKLSSDQAKEIQREVTQEANILINMVAPRWFERQIHFRGRKSAQRQIKKARKKKLRDAS